MKKFIDINSLSRQRRHQILREYNNTGRKPYRKNLYELSFGDICKVCNVSKSIELHHKDGNNKNETVDNLIPVCKKCHMLAHKILRKGKRHRLDVCYICKKEYKEHFIHIPEHVCRPCYDTNA